MIEPLSPNTQAILLLTAPLLAGRGGVSPDLLRLSEYNRLARALRQNHNQPADLLGPKAAEVLEVCARIFGRQRLDSLLGRGFLLGQAVDRWNARGIWVLSRADAQYPRRLKARLKEEAPPLLYGCGNAALIDQGGLAVVGSRHAAPDIIQCATNAGQLAAQARRTLVSGGAKGVDQAAMTGALQAAGQVAGVLPDALERAALAPDNRDALREGRLALVSPYDPASAFNAVHAVQRNKLIYALADAALVVTSEYQKGGTWGGALEQLERLHCVPIFVTSSPPAGPGNPALLQRGAFPWPDPKTAEDLDQALAKAADLAAAQPRQETLPL